MMVLNRHVTDVPSVVTDNAGRRPLRRASTCATSVIGASPMSPGRRPPGRTAPAGVGCGPPPPNWAWPAAVSARSRRPCRAALQPPRNCSRHLPTAVLAYNDQIAIGILRSLRQLRIAVPGDVSIVGFDDIFASSLVTPSLTTIAAPLRQMGAIAVKNLVAILNGASPNCAEPLVVPTRLIERESTGPARRG